jgi:hypothetical protein
MPDAGASRKRQIQVALRPFGGMAAPGAARQRIPRAAALFCGAFLQGCAQLGRRSIEAAVPPDAAKIRRRHQAIFSVLKRGAFEMETRDSNSFARAGRFLIRPARFHVAADADFHTACKSIWSPGNMGFCNFFAVPSRRWIDGHEPKRQRGSREPFILSVIGLSGDRHYLTLSILVFLMCLTPRGGGNRWLYSRDSTSNDAWERERGAERSLQPNRAPNGAFKKYLIETMAYKESSITTACYLCNTRRKRRGVGRFGAVPLLRVQTLSVIVILRRRGASRGRPVLGGSLKSLAFMRECPKARSD